MQRVYDDFGTKRVQTMLGYDFATHNSTYKYIILDYLISIEYLRIEIKNLKTRSDRAHRTYDA